MIQIDIPGFQTVGIRHVLLDYNGTIAADGRLIEGVAAAFGALSQQVDLHVITADTFGQAQTQLQDLPCQIAILPAGNQTEAKLAYAHQLGLDQTVCIGNGRNDRLMVKEAVIGIALIQSEGAAVETVMSANIVCHHIVEALLLLTEPKRLIATLRT